MGNEARKILMEEGGKRTIADAGFVKALINKYKPLLEGLPDRTEHERYILGVTAMLMENQTQYLTNLDEDTLSTNVGSFTKFIFPVLRRVFPNLIANDIVSVQPMTAPVGAVFFLNYVYGTTKGTTASGKIFPRDFDKDYSSEYINGEPFGPTPNSATVTFNGSLSFTPVWPLDSTGGTGHSVTVEVLAADGVTVLVTATDDGAGNLSGSGVTSGTINYTSGAISITFSSAPATGTSVKALYYYDGEASSLIPEIQLDIQKQPVTAVPRRLKALWSSEAAEDLRAFHGIDAETEMVAMTAQEIALEIDREVVLDLFANSTTTTGTFNRPVPPGVNELDHLRSMVTQISTVSNLIHKKSLRAPANFIVTSPEISALLAQLTTHGDYRPLWLSGPEPMWTTPADAPRPLTQHGQFGIYKSGTLMNKWVIYEDPFFPSDKMLVGLKGSNYLDAGYVWAPYIPLQVTPTFLDPADFTFRKGLRTRYAKQLLRPEFYGQIAVSGL